LNILAVMYLVAYHDIATAFDTGLIPGLAKMGLMTVALGVGFPIAVWVVTGDMGEYIEYGGETNHD